MQTLDEALTEVEARFLLSLPPAELQKVDRLFFHIEEAHWFYEDFFADLHEHLPHFPLKIFTEKIFEHCPLFETLRGSSPALVEEFKNYKRKIPVFGCALLNPEMTKVALQCNYKGTSWGWPKGKVNEGEDSLACAIRETLEETGFDPAGHCNGDHFVEGYIDGKYLKIYIAVNVPEDTVFVPQTRKEVSKVEFISFGEIPHISSYGVVPFLNKIQKWIDLDGSKIRKAYLAGAKKSKSQAGPTTVGKKEKGGAVAIDEKNSKTFETDAASAKGWNVGDMFEANSKLTGRSYSSYDGNPHDFGSMHPRYINYNSATLGDGARVSITTTSEAAYGAVGKPVQYFGKDFQLDIKSVMQAVEDVLLR